MQEQSIISSSQALAEVLAQVFALAEIDRCVLVLGERGTGKERVVERLHFLSPRWLRDLVKVNCAALNDNLLESELYKLGLSQLQQQPIFDALTSAYEAQEELAFELKRHLLEQHSQLYCPMADAASTAAMPNAPANISTSLAI